MDLFDLVAKITLDSSEYERGLETAKGKASSFGDKLKGGLKTAGKIGAGAVATVATAAIGLSTALVKGANDTAAYGDNIDKMSQKLGMSAEAYQEWDAIMQHSGASIDSMQKGMTTLSSAVESGNEAFEALGISLDEASAMSQEELFDATITALQNMESGTERTVLAQKLLGGSAKELGALLNTSAEDTEAMRQRVHELGGVMSDEAVAASAHFQDSLQDMQTAFSSLGRGLTAEFMPGITSVMDGLTEVFSGNGETGIGMISDGIDGLITTLTEQLPQFLDLGVGIIESLATAIIDNIPALSTAAIEIMLQLVDMIVDNLPSIISAAIEILLKLVDAINDNLPKLADAAIDIIMSLVDGIVDALPKLIPAVVQIILTLVEKLTEPDTIMRLVEAAFKIITALAKGIIAAIPKILAAVPTIISNFVQALIQFIPTIFANGKQMIGELAGGIASAAGEVWDSITDVLSGVWQRISEWVGAAKDWGTDMIQNFINGIVGMATRLWDSVKEIGKGIANLLGFSEPKEGPLSNFHTYAPDMMELFAKGVRDNEDMLRNTVSDAFDFGDMTVESVKTIKGNMSGDTASDGNYAVPIIVQCVLDGQIVSENTTMWQRRMARAAG